MMPKLLIIARIAALALVPVAAGQASTRILFVGNSLTFWNEGLYVHLERFATSATPPLSVTTGPQASPMRMRSSCGTLPGKPYSRIEWRPSAKPARRVRLQADRSSLEPGPQ